MVDVFLDDALELDAGVEKEGLNITSRNTPLVVTGTSGDVMQHVKLNMSE